MNRFMILLKKELRELLTLQLILPLVAVILVFNLLGSQMKKAGHSDSQKKRTVSVLNQDSSEFTQAMLQSLSGSFEITFSQSENPEQFYSEQEKTPGAVQAIVIPENFSSQLLNNNQVSVSVCSFIRDFSIRSMKKTGDGFSFVSALEKKVRVFLLTREGLNPLFLTDPVKIEEAVRINHKTASTDPSEVFEFITSQTSLIPMILFLVLITSSQMLASAVATEKEDKTLETLLSCPVSRHHIIFSKMLAAGTAALLIAVCYIFGFKNYMQGISDLSSSPAVKNASEALVSLGLTLTPSGIFITGVTLFLGLLCALSLVVILSVFAENSKSVQGLITPVMLLVMVSYLISFFLDISSLPSVLKILMYLNPFTYTFTSVPWMFLGRYPLIIKGIIYQFFIFLILLYTATRIFSSDLLITMKLSRRKKN